MKQEEYKEMPQALYEDAYTNAWNVESMEAHEAGDRPITYIGSRVRPGGLVFDFFRDNTGAWWYDTRFMEPSGEIVSMERHIFGHEIKERRREGKSAWRR